MMFSNMPKYSILVVYCIASKRTLYCRHNKINHAHPFSESFETKEKSFESDENNLERKEIMQTTEIKHHHHPTKVVVAIDKEI